MKYGNPKRFLRPEHTMTKSYFIIVVALFLGLSVNAQEVFMTKLGTDRAQQGIAAWGRYIFSLEDGGKVNVYPFKKGKRSPVGSFSLESSCKENHANNAEFGIEKIKGATAPLLYVSVGKPGSSIDWTCYVESISKKGGQWESTLVQRLQLDTTLWASKGYSAIFGAPSWLVDRKNKTLWVFSAVKRTTPKVTKSADENAYIATGFRIPSLAEGELVRLGADDIIRQVIFPFDVWFTQAGCIKDGVIWYCFGLGEGHPDTPASIRAYDTVRGRIIAEANISKAVIQEPEDLFFRGKYLYINCNSSKRSGSPPVIYRYKP